MKTLYNRGGAGRGPHIRPHTVLAHNLQAAPCDPPARRTKSSRLGGGLRRRRLARPPRGTWLLLDSHVSHRHEQPGRAACRAWARLEARRSFCTRQTRHSLNRKAEGTVSQVLGFFVVDAPEDEGTRRRGGGRHR
eukprot:scaffold2404_cov398-Prasinococcus_capsulatus_cf.AAC.45